MSFNISEQLKKPDLNIKTLIDWDNFQKVEQLTLQLCEMQSDLQGKMTQSIQSHILGKQKILQLLKDSLPIILQDKKHQIKVDSDLDPLIEMMEIKNKIDYALQQLEPMMNKNDE